MSRILLGIIAALIIAASTLGVFLKNSIAENATLTAANKTMAEQAVQWDKDLKEARASEKSLNKLLLQRETEQREVRYQNDRLRTQLTKIRERNPDVEIYMASPIPSGVFDILRGASGTSTTEN